MPEPVGDLVNGAIRLEASQVPEASFEWLRALFHEAWNRVPSPGCHSSPHFMDSYDPRIILFRDGIPGVRHGGHLMQMPIDFLAAMPRELAVLAVVHELAHVSWYAEGEPQHWRLHDAGPASYNASERLVDGRLLDWGFCKEELDAADQWLASHSVQ
jgi:hypothetical protein